MKRWYGKLLGFFVGLALMRGSPVGALLGLLIGHVFDAGWLRPRRRDSMRDDPLRDQHRDNPHAVFGLGADASDTEVDLAYRRLIAQYHPDRLIGAAADQRQQAEARARAVNIAYDRIKARRKQQP